MFVKRQVKTGFILLLTPMLGLSLLCAQTTAENDIHRIIREIDELYRSDSSHAQFEMEIATPHWQRTLAMEAWTEKLEKTFVRIERPIKEKGVATLRIGNEMWNYLPKTNKVIKIPPSMMMSSWMGSDFTNDDIVKEFSLFEDYTYEEVFPYNTEEALVYVKCTPRENLPVVWGYVVIAAQRQDSIPHWQKYYDETGELMRTLKYSDVKDFGGRRVPATMEMVPHTKEGHKTVIRYLQLSFNEKMDSKIFSFRNLRARGN